MSPHHFIHRAQQMKRACKGPSYLDCVTEHAEVCAMAKEFARVLGKPALENPRLLLTYFKKSALRNPSVQVKEKIDN